MLGVVDAELVDAVPPACRGGTGGPQLHAGPCVAEAVLGEAWRILYTAGVLVAAADGAITDDEVEALGALLGSERMSGPLSLDVARKDIEGRLREAREGTSLLHRAQVMQHLAIIAGADGEVSPGELDLLGRFATDLGVDIAVVTQALQAAASPMD